MASESNSAESVAQPDTLFARRSLLFFTFAAVLLASIIVWAMGGVRDGQGAVIGVLTLVACITVGGFVRWRFRLGLRTFLILVTILGIVFSFIAKVTIRVRRIEAGVTELEKQGATVYFNTSGDGGWFRSPSGFFLPGWTRDVFGEAAFADVYAIDFQGVRVARETIQKAVDSCPTIHRVSFYQSVLEPDALAPLADLEGLHFLDLTGSSVSDKDMHAIAGLRSLKQISLSGTKTTPLGAKSLKGISSLETIWTDGTTASDAWLREIGPKPNMNNLAAINGSLTDVGVKAIVELAPRVNVLSLQGNRGITSASAAEIATLRNLSYLTLDNTSIDDRTLEALTDVPSLKNLSVRRTAVTEEGVRAFTKRRPNVIVKHVFDIPPRRPPQGN